MVLRASLRGNARRVESGLVLLIGTGVCASAVESAQVAVQLPAVSHTPRCTSSDRVCVDGSGVSWDSRQPTLLCIRVRDVAERVWYGGRSYGLLGAERSDLSVLSVVRSARCNVLLTFFAVRLASKEA